MKTTIDISDSLMQEMKSASVKKKTTLKNIIEEAVRKYLDELKTQSSPFKLKKSHFKGSGYVSSDLEDNWAKIRDISYGMDK